MGAKKPSGWRCSSRLPSFQKITLALFATAAVLLLVHYIGVHRQRRRKERLLQNFRRDYLALEAHMRTEAQTSSRKASIHPSALKSRGIVICAGGDTLLSNVYVSVKVLRSTLNCSLPVEIYHKGPKDVKHEFRTALAEFADVKFIDLLSLPLPAHHPPPSEFSKYVLKIFSLYSTSFDQVLLLDADSQPLKDPALLFDSRSFTETGNLFWSDFWAAGSSESPEKVVYSWLGLKAPWTYLRGWRCAESGQVFFDRRRHPDVLEWLWFLNSHSTLLYDHMLGDKDTFEIAFVLAGKEALYTRAAHGPGLPVSGLQPYIYHEDFSKGARGEKESHDRYLRLGMLQFDEFLDPAFLHRTERTKFATKGKPKGYSLEIMQPQFFVPPLSSDTAAKIRRQSWRVHSLPAGLADANCSCCGSHVLPSESATGYGGQVVQAAMRVSCSAEGDGVSRIPIFPYTALGRHVNAVTEAGLQAFRDLQKLRKASPASLFGRFSRQL